MIGRALATIVLVLLAGGAFWGDALGAGRVNPFGILLLFLAVLNWYVWGVMRDGYASARWGTKGARLPLDIAFGPAFIRQITKLRDPSDTPTTKVDDAQD